MTTTSNVARSYSRLIYLPWMPTPANATDEDAARPPPGPTRTTPASPPSTGNTQNSGNSNSGGNIRGYFRGRGR